MTDRILMSKQLKDPNYLGSHDLVKSVSSDGQPVYGEITLTIKSVDLEAVTDMEAIRKNQRGKNGEPPTKDAYVMRFEEPVKPYIIKAATVIQAVERATGTRVVNAWPGKQITFFVETGVYMPGTRKADNITTDALRVRPYAPKKSLTYTCADCGREDVGENVAQYAKKTVGAIVCADCGKKRKAVSNT